jgi:signal transduction histidine kinase
VAAKDDGRRRWRSLTWRLAAIYSLTSLVIVLVLGVAVHFLTEYYLHERLEEELGAQAGFYAAYAAQLARDEATLAGAAPTIVDLFAPQADLNVRFFSVSTGALLASTEDLGSLPSREALAELRYRSPSLITRPGLQQPHRRYEARAVLVGGGAIGVVEVSRSTLGIEGFLATLRQILLVVLVVALAVSLLVSVLLARQLSAPVLDMEEATARIAEGDRDVRLRRYPANELGRLAEGINFMAERLQGLEAARTQFISEVSHDLRTPLTAIKGMLVNMIDDAGPKERSSLEIAERETDRMIRLVNQLLDYSRWEAGKLTLNLRPVDVGEICSSVVGLSQMAAQHRGIVLSEDIAPSLPTIVADSDRLQRVVFNLLENAIKFTPRGGQIRLAVDRHQDGVQISVQDTGRGMTDEEVERAFQSEWGGEGGSTGLGLNIARAIVEEHGGRMGIESRPGHGTRVWLILPRNSRSFSDNTEVTS